MNKKVIGMTMMVLAMGSISAFAAGSNENTQSMQNNAETYTVRVIGNNQEFQAAPVYLDEAAIQQKQVMQDRVKTHAVRVKGNNQEFRAVSASYNVNSESRDRSETSAVRVVGNNQEYLAVTENPAK